MAVQDSERDLHSATRTPSSNPSCNKLKLPRQPRPWMEETERQRMSHLLVDGAVVGGRRTEEGLRSLGLLRLYKLPWD